MDEMNTDWLDEFDDSVLNDTIEANDSSALTGFDNTETETETTSPLEADNNVKQPGGDFWDNLANYTPEINYSRDSGPPSSNSGGSNHGSGTSASGSSSGGSSGGSDSTSGGGDSGSTSGGSEGGSTSSGGSLTSRIKNAIATATSAAATAAGSSGGLTGHLSSGLAGIASHYGSEAAKDAGNAAATAAADSQDADLSFEAAKEQVNEAVKDAEEAREEYLKAAKEYNELAKMDPNNFPLSTGEYEFKPTSIVDTTGEVSEISKIVYTGNDPEKIAFVNSWNESVDNLIKTSGETYEASLSLAKANDAAEAAEKKSEEMKQAAKEALERAQAAQDKAGSLAGEAGEAYKRAQEKQKEWEQKQKEAEDAARAESKDGTTTSDSAINNPVTLDLATSLANSGAKMTETEYKQVADFVANHPELASLINGGLTGAEKATIGNVIAGIQAINDGNYLTAAKEFAQGLGMSLVSAVQLISTGIYGAGARIYGVIKSFMENPDIDYNDERHAEDFKTFKQMRDDYGDSSELQALYDTSKGTTEQKQTFDYMKDNTATNVGEYNEGLVEDVNKVVSDASRKVIHYSPYVLEAVKKWR